MVSEESCKILVDALKKIEMGVKIGKPLSPELPIYTAGYAKEIEYNINEYVDEIRDVVKKECKGIRPTPALSKTCKNWEFGQVDFGSAEYFQKFLDKLGITHYIHQTHPEHGTNLFLWGNPKNGIIIRTYSNPLTGEARKPSDEWDERRAGLGRAEYLDVKTAKTNDTIRVYKTLDKVIDMAIASEKKKPKEQRSYPHYYSKSACYSDVDFFISHFGL